MYTARVKQAQAKAFAKPVIILLFGISLWLVASNFPRMYPDQTLKIENALSSFITSITLPIKMARLSLQPVDTTILMPVYGKKVSGVANTWQADRDGGDRSHEGQDIFAAKGTPVFSGTYGYVRRISNTTLGGLNVMITGAGGRRYYYAHFDKVAEGLKVGQEVTVDTVLGFVGSTGNAKTTPAHLHFGMYQGREAINPLPLLVDR